MQQKAKEAILSKFKFVLDKISSKMKAMENSVKKTYNALNAYSWDPFDPVQHCQGEWNGKLEVEKLTSSSSDK